MNVSNKELDAIHAAIDFIETNADGAADPEPYIEMMQTLRGLHTKGKEARHKRMVQYYLKKLVNKKSK